MANTLKQLEPILKEVYKRQLMDMFKTLNYEQAVRCGWKRPRNRRIKWIDVQKNKTKRFFHYEKINPGYSHVEDCYCWRCRLYRRIDNW